MKLRYKIYKTIRSNLKVVTVIAIALIGSIVIFSAKAAMPTASNEPESGGIKPLAIKCDAATASANSYVKFGSNNCGYDNNPLYDFKKSAVSSLINPTHFDDTYYSWPYVKDGFKQMQVRIKTTGPTSSDGYYWSNTFYWQTPDPNITEFQGGYFGVQNFAPSHGNQPIAIFSIWNTTKAVSSGYVVPFGNEGSGMSVRIPILWQSGKTYELMVEKSTNQRGSPADKVWWDAFVREYPNGTIKSIGSIEAPRSLGNMTTSSSATFHERFTGPVSPGCPVQNSTGEFTHHSANYGLFVPTYMSHYSPTITACNGKYSVTQINNGYRSVIGAN